MSELMPILLCPVIVSEESSKFLLPNKKVTITMPSSLANELIEICDGTHSLDVIKEYFSQDYEQETIVLLFDELLRNDVLVNSRNVSGPFIEYVKNPTAWGHKLTSDQITVIVKEQWLQKPPSPLKLEHSDLIQSPWTNLLSSRKSCRNFGKTEFSQEALTVLLWSAYGVGSSKILEDGTKSVLRRTVPSAGGLYPLILHLVLFQHIGDWKAGVYRLYSTRPFSVELEIVTYEYEKEIEQCFVETRTLKQSVGCVIFSGNMSRSTSKYSNRGISYTILEAGHAAQNLHLAAVGLGLDSIEIGGFLEDEVLKLTQLSDDYLPITVCIFGRGAESVGDPVSVSVVQASIIKKIIDAPLIEEYTPPFHIKLAQSFWLSTGGAFWACGRSKNQELAEIKAIAEAAEWYSCSCATEHEIVQARFCELPLVVHPHEIVQYSKSQLQEVKGIYDFKESQSYEWVKVQNVFTREWTYVLADFVFFPFTQKNGRRYIYGNSSGCAAHVTYEQALENAVLEIVEREAFIVTWLNKLSRDRISIESLPDDFQERVKILEALNFHVTFVNITYDLAPVVMVVAERVDQPFLTCASAAGFDVRELCDKALMELESAVYTHLRFGPARRILLAKEIDDVMDHGAYYEDSARIKEASFLFGSDEGFVAVSDIQRISSIQNRESLYQKIQSFGMTIYGLDITSEQVVATLPYRVVRAIVPGMVPISFGYKREALELHRVRSLPVSCGLMSQMLNVEHLNTSPHPFT
jgi:ribosomal protein S12 methylthiotransferase accessory factor